jgi:hypothetical protein
MKPLYIICIALVVILITVALYFLTRRSEGFKNPKSPSFSMFKLLATYINDVYYNNCNWNNSKDKACIFEDLDDVTRLYADVPDLTNPLVNRFSTVLFGTIGLLRSEPSTAILIVRGTVDTNDWIHDALFNQVSIFRDTPSFIPGAKVSDGFLSIYDQALSSNTSSGNCKCISDCDGLCRVSDADGKAKKCGSEWYYNGWGYYAKCEKFSAKSFEDQVKTWISNHNIDKVIIAGHSLGASVASIAAARILFLTNLKVDLYLYSSPKTGNKVFADYLENNADNIYRFYNESDIVPTVPKGEYYPVGNDYGIKFCPKAGCSTPITAHQMPVYVDNFDEWKNSSKINWS